MKKIIIYFLFLLINLILLACTSTPNNKTALSPNCSLDGFQFVDKQLIFTNISSVYLIKNNSSSTLYLNHPADRPGTASAGWASKLDPQKWSALSVNRPQFNWTCQLADKPFTYVSCSNAIQVCRFSSNKKPTKTFWLAENKIFSHLTNKI